MIARDGMAHLIRMVEIIILEKLPKLQDGVKDQVCNLYFVCISIKYDVSKSCFGWCESLCKHVL